MGPSIGRLRLAGGNKIETGNFHSDDSDGKTLRDTSPRVTLREGDLWNYEPHAATDSNAVREYEQNE